MTSARRSCRVTATLLVAVTLVECTGPEPEIPARRDFHHGAHISTAYQRVENYTRVELEPMALTLVDSVKPRRSLSLSAWFVVAGPAVSSPPERVRVTLTSSTSGALFDGLTLLPLLLDDSTRVVLSRSDYDIHYTGSTVEEDLSVSLPRRDFLRIVNAHSVEGSLGGVDEFRLSDAQLEALRDFASRMRPAP